MRESAVHADMFPTRVFVGEREPAVVGARMSRLGRWLSAVLRLPAVRVDGPMIEFLDVGTRAHLAAGGGDAASHEVYERAVAGAEKAPLKTLTKAAAVEPAAPAVAAAGTPVAPAAPGPGPAPGPAAAGTPVEPRRPPTRGSEDGTTEGRPRSGSSGSALSGAPLDSSGTWYSRAWYV